MNFTENTPGAEDSYQKDLQFYVSKMARDLNKLNRVMQTFLLLKDLSNQNFSKSRIDLANVFDYTIRTISLENPEVSLRFSCTESLWAEADVHFLEVLMHNIIGNAFKFRSKDRLLHVNFYKIEDLERDIFVIEDNGVGFDPVYSEEIFKPFFQVPREAATPGEGLGLAVAERIAHMHGGSIYAHAEVDQGCRIFFSFTGG